MELSNKVDLIMEFILNQLSDDFEKLESVIEMTGLSFELVDYKSIINDQQMELPEKILKCQNLIDVSIKEVDKELDFAEWCFMQEIDYDLF